MFGVLPTLKSDMDVRHYQLKPNMGLVPIRYVSDDIKSTSYIIVGEERMVRIKTLVDYCS